MLRLAATNDTVSVVADQLGQPTWTGDLAERIVAMLDADAPAGIYHGTNSGRDDLVRLRAGGLQRGRIEP